jgi:hypothetical protein
MLHHLIDVGTNRLKGLDAQSASLFPRISLHPLNFTKQAAIAPPVYVDIDGKNSIQGAVHLDLKVKRLHGDGSGLEISKAQCSSRPDWQAPIGKV